MAGTHARNARTDPTTPADGRSDGELGRQVRQSGNAAAVAELYRRHHSAVLNCARTFARDPHTAEDLASEVFARVLRALPPGDAPSVD